MNAIRLSIMLEDCADLDQGAINMAKDIEAALRNAGFVLNRVEQDCANAVDFDVER